MARNNGLSVDERIEALMAQRYPGGQMDALGKSFFSKIGKALKKVAPIALGAAALFYGGPLVAGALSKATGGKGAKAPKLPKGAKVAKAAKKVAKGAGRVAVAVAQDAASAAISAGAIPLQPGALRSNEELLSTAVQIARSQLMNEGISMRSPDAQDIVRQAVQEAGQVPPDTGFDFKKSLPWIVGGGALLAAVALASPRRAR